MFVCNISFWENTKINNQTHTHWHTHTHTPGEAFSRLNLVAGDDAAAVAWTEIHSDLRLYASHTHFIHLSVELRGAAW